MTDEPTIEISVENTTLPAGSYFSASCETDGNPKPELSWTFTSDSGDSLKPDNFVTGCKVQIFLKVVNFINSKFFKLQ